MNAETGLPTRPVQLPQPSIALSDPHAYWSQAKFHRFFRCPRTQRRVTFADVGDENGPVVVGFLPSLCSRYVGIVMADGLAEEVGVRLLVMDRPGSGGTERCDLNDRVSITCGSCLFIIDWNLSGSLTEIEMTESLLDHLEIRDVMLLGCSAGVIHLLEYVRLHPDRLSKLSPTICLVSPWFPGNVYLPWIPASLVENAHRVMPVIDATVSGSVDWVSSLFSGFGSLSSLRSTFSSSPPDFISEQLVSHTPAQAAPGGTTKFIARFMSPESAKLMRTYMFAESQQGMSQEYLLCLGKGIGGTDATKTGTRKWFAATIVALQAPIARDVNFKVWWGGSDGIVPRKARDALNDLFAHAPGVRFAHHTLKDADHDEPMLCMEGLGEALLFLKRRADIR